MNINMGYWIPAYAGMTLYETGMTFYET